MPATPLSWAQLYLYPPLVTLLLWGGLTAGMLALNRRGATAARLALLLSLAGLALAHWQLWDSRADTSQWGAYRAFIAGICVWSWHELAFYSGLLTGPWAAPCPPEARGWRRLGYALGTHLYHEAAVAVELALLAWMLRDGGNWLGPLTVALCWALQHSAKLNVLLGVRSLQVELFPAHLRYLGSYWAPRPSNPFFLPSALAIALLAGVLWLLASRLSAGAAVGAALLATLATFGLLEHLLLVLAPPFFAPAAPPRPAPGLDG